MPVVRRLRWHELHPINQERCTEWADFVGAWGPADVHEVYDGEYLYSVVEFASGEVVSFIAGWEMPAADRQRLHECPTAPGDVLFRADAGFVRRLKAGERVWRQSALTARVAP